MTYTITPWLATVTEGKNRFYLSQPFQAKKGNMIYLESLGYTAKFYYVTDKDELYEDFVLNGTINYLHKIELWKRSNILISVLTEPKLYSRVVSLTGNYSAIGDYNVTVKNKNSLEVNMVTKEIKITNSKKD